MTLSGATTLGQSEPESNGNEAVLQIPQSSSITGTSPSDCFVSYPEHSLRRGVGLTPQQRCSRCILQPQPKVIMKKNLFMYKVHDVALLSPLLAGMQYCLQVFDKTVVKKQGPNTYLCKHKINKYSDCHVFTKFYLLKPNKERENACDSSIQVHPYKFNHTWQAK